MNEHSGKRLLQTSQPHSHTLPDTRYAPLHLCSSHVRSDNFYHAEIRKTEQPLLLISFPLSTIVSLSRAPSSLRCFTSTPSPCAVSRQQGTHKALVSFALTSLEHLGHDKECCTDKSNRNLLYESHSFCRSPYGDVFHKNSFNKISGVISFEIRSLKT